MRARTKLRAFSLYSPKGMRSPDRGSTTGDSQLDGRTEQRQNEQQQAAETSEAESSPSPPYLKKSSHENAGFHVARLWGMRIPTVLYVGSVRPQASPFPLGNYYLPPSAHTLRSENPTSVLTDGSRPRHRINRVIYFRQGSRVEHPVPVPRYSWSLTIKIGSCTTPMPAMAASRSASVSVVINPGVVMDLALYHPGPDSAHL